MIHLAKNKIHDKRKLVQTDNIFHKLPTYTVKPHHHDCVY